MAADFEPPAPFVTLLAVVVPNPVSFPTALTQARQKLTS